MKKLLLLFFLSVLLFLLSCAPTASAQHDWTIETFHTEITVQKDSSLIIEEKILADFSKAEKHGIYRNIPIKYTRKGQNYKLRLKVLEITDENKTPWNYKKSYDGGYIILKIGHPDITYQEPKTFNIKYEVKRAVNFFGDHAEVYFNATGDEWDTVIKKSSAEITIPEGVKENALKSTCYTGIHGSLEQNCDTEIKNNRFTFNSTEELNPGEGLTIVAGFPKYLVKEPKTAQKIAWFFQDNFIYPIPLIVFVILLIQWYRKGRDPEKKTIIPRWELPINLTASEIGTIVDEKADLKDISAAIIDMAVKGYLKIKEIEEKKLLLFKETDYEFHKLKEPDDNLKQHEKEILSAIFGESEITKLSALKNKFYTHLPNIKEYLYAEVVAQNFFRKSPDKIRKHYIGGGMTILITGIMVGATMTSLKTDGYGPQVMIASVLSGILILIFGNYMPRKTEEGMKAYEHILGIKKYIETAEKDRIKFQEKEKIFERLLAPAMVLGVADKWAKTFEGIYKTPPDWYEGRYDHFTPYILVSHLNNMSAANTETFTSSPKGAGSGGSGFGGGGFSGGGSGGGGGSSW